MAREMLKRGKDGLKIMNYEGAPRCPDAAKGPTGVRAGDTLRPGQQRGKDEL
jgi:hypothetical protein